MWDRAAGRTLSGGAASAGVTSHVVQLGNCDVYCWGKWTGSPASGAIFDSHIDSGSAAIDYGDVAYIGWQTGADDKCDLDGNGEKEEDLPCDFDAPNGRNQGGGPAPDAGVYEIPD